jgi:THO complex subunit 1
VVDQGFRDILLFKLIGELPKVEKFISLSIEACRKDMATQTIPVVLLGDFFDASTIDRCELLFKFVEENVMVWKEDCFFQACKNNILRMCNDLLRRLSRSQNTVFCGRILLFLATFFPFSERSGLNIISEFNLENITEYGADANELTDEPSEKGDGQLQIDYNLYCKFWALQDYFRNPNQCYDKLKWKTFQLHSSGVLSAFSSFKLEEPRGHSSKTALADEAMDVTENNLKETHHFFAKFLTNPKLLSLQLSDSNFRRSVLVQFLILFQYLNSTVKFKA